MAHDSVAVQVAVQVDVAIAYSSHFSFDDGRGERAGREAPERRTFLKKLINEMLINFCQSESSQSEPSRVESVAWYRGARLTSGPSRKAARQAGGVERGIRCGV